LNTDGKVDQADVDYVSNVCNGIPNLNWWPSWLPPPPTLPPVTQPTAPVPTPPAFVPENCTDGVDNDGDRAADCYDTDCCGNTICTYTMSSYQRGLICGTTQNNLQNSNLIITNGNQWTIVNYPAGGQSYGSTSQRSQGMSSFGSTIRRMLGY
jgi:hypothetical protein